MAARMGRTAVVSLLIEVGANADLQNKVKIVCAPGDVIWEIYIQGHQCLTARVFYQAVWRFCTDDSCQGGLD